MRLNLELWQLSHMFFNKKHPLGVSVWLEDAGRGELEALTLVKSQVIFFSSSCGLLRKQQKRWVAQIQKILSLGCHVDY